jgi:hypothetical protein
VQNFEKKFSKRVPEASFARRGSRGEVREASFARPVSRGEFFEVVDKKEENNTLSCIASRLAYP